MCNEPWGRESGPAKSITNLGVGSLRILPVLTHVVANGLTAAAVIDGEDHRVVAERVLSELHRLLDQAAVDDVVANDVTASAAVDGEGQRVVLGSVLWRLLDPVEGAEAATVVVGAGRRLLVPTVVAEAAAALDVIASSPG